VLPRRDGGRVRQLAHAEVVDDQQGHRGEFGQELSSGPGDVSFRDLLDERARLAVDDAIAL
jgi:hypothetical protein